MRRATLLTSTRSTMTDLDPTFDESRQSSLRTDTETTAKVYTKRRPIIVS